MLGQVIRYVPLILCILSSSGCAVAQAAPFDEDRIAEELVAMELRDQEVRSAQKVDVDEVLRVDAQNTQRLNEIMKSMGWPRISAVGRKAADAAALLALHADRDPQFQRRALELMQPLVETKEVNPEQFAYLWDRTHVPQRFGTQGGCSGTAWAPGEIEDPAQVESRRAAMGMRPLSEYVAIASEMLCQAKQ
ncbi:DUF6624 domain-containing protein [uncultured Stenotrophomonas sp.]|uniref:DUF6624 domain-containing protein n=1 Tax=uncultured Stenotrophomonas sp. TaxID=165438 RepID=UPI0028F00BF1|nr:DUF6624 domain-containing protein [uncultured Stenotrophomonas sp.]